MADVIDLARAKEEREPHVAGHLFCMACSHEWSAVWKPGTIAYRLNAGHSVEVALSTKKLPKGPRK